MPTYFVEAHSTHFFDCRHEAILYIARYAGRDKATVDAMIGTTLARQAATAIAAPPTVAPVRMQLTWANLDDDDLYV